MADTPGGAWLLAACLLVAAPDAPRAAAAADSGTPGTPAVSAPAPARIDAPEPTPRLPAAQPTVIGHSVEGRPVEAYRWNAAAGPAVLVLGAVHGDERESGQLAELLLQRWQADASLLAGRHVVLVPFVNPDGWAADTRGNARGVDLNRNFPDRWEPGRRGHWAYPGSEPLSEPEARAIYDLVAREPVARVVTLHSCRRCGGANNFDGPARALAALMRTINGYRVLDEWPMPTPGSFGTFAGKVRRIPTITLEMPRAGVDAEAMRSNARAVEAVVHATTHSVEALP